MRDLHAPYTRYELRSDLTAGITTAVLLVPQAMAYAMIAGLPPQAGLYASIVPVAAYAVTGSSRYLSVGPVAVVSLLVASAIVDLQIPGENAAAAAMLLALLSGGILFLLGLVKGGSLDTFLSHTVIKGYTAAAAVIISLSQLKNLSGIPLGHSENAIRLLHDAITHLAHVHIPTLMVGIGSLLALAVLRKVSSKIPGALIVLVISTALVYLFRLDRAGIAVVGIVPSGFPAFRLPPLDFTLLPHLLPPAITLAVVGYVESIAVARTLATKNRETVDSNRELMGLGFANMAGAFFQAFPVAGGLSRTAVNYQAGAKTRYSSLITAGVVALAVMFFTPLLYYIPRASLAAVIIVAVSSLADIDGAKRTFHLRRKDGYVLLATFLVSLTWGVEQGILTGVLASLGLFIWRSVKPHCAVLGIVEGESEVYRNVERFKTLTWPQAVIFRIDASLYFANAAYFEQRVMELLAGHKEARAIIIDGSGINDIDAPAEETLRNLAINLKARNCRLLFASLKGPVRDLLERAGFPECIGPECFFPGVSEAVHFLQLPIPARGKTGGPMNVTTEDIFFTFEMGSEYAPDSPHGREVLALRTNGALTYQAHRGSITREESSTADPREIERIRKHLAEAQFPEIPDHTIPPGGSLVAITVREGSKECKVIMQYHLAGSFEGYREIISMTDAWLAAFRKTRKTGDS